MVAGREAGLLALAVLVGAGPALAETCDGGDALALNASVDFGEVVRAKAPAALFGFNVPWRDFQIGFWREGRVRPELIELLKPFKGATYRYPGGSPSNTFDWSMSRGPMADRKPVHADFGRRAKVEFGLAEFSRFLSDVDGQAILTANLTGTADTAGPLSAVADIASQFAAQVAAEFPLPCKAGASCRLLALELGNELDWPPYKMNGQDYGERAAAFRSAVAPKLAGVPWVVAGKTAAWERKDGSYEDFNRQVLAALAPGIEGLAIHPYYDGLPVPEMLRYVGKYLEAIHQVTPGGGVYVTEHARWPARPAQGPWEPTWYTTTSLGGALSTADFLLGLMPMQGVQAANWHALAAAGPWQLVRLGPDGNQLLPTALYWGLRVLRGGYLDDVVRLQYTATKQSRYSGGYDQRLVAMRGGARRSVLGINRAQQPLRLQLSIKNQAAGAATGNLAWVSAGSVEAQNTAAEPGAVKAATRAWRSAPADGPTSVCIPPLSIFAIDIAP